jgi:hypothetical protein
MYSFDPSVNLGGIELNSFRLPQPGKYAFENIAKTENTSPSTVDKGDSFERILNIMLDPTRRKQALEDTLEFQNRQQAAAAPYNIAYKGLDTLSKLPEQISANAANRAMLTVLGAKSVTDAGNAAMANSPFGKGSFVSQVPLSQQRYFS